MVFIHDSQEKTTTLWLSPYPNSFEWKNTQKGKIFFIIVNHINEFWLNLFFFCVPNPLIQPYSINPCADNPQMARGRDLRSSSTQCIPNDFRFIFYFCVFIQRNTFLDHTYQQKKITQHVFLMSISTLLAELVIILKMQFSSRSMSNLGVVALCLLFRC